MAPVEAVVDQLLVAQLTDTHVVDPALDPHSHEELFVDNNAQLALAVGRINAESPAMSAVLATGDLTNWALPVEYEALADLLRPLRAPVLALAGNHDERESIRAAFPGLPWARADHASWVIDVGGIDTTIGRTPTVRIAGLDSTRPGEPGGEFDDAREAWLRSVLSTEPSHRGPTILAMHHPPFSSGIAWMDAAGFVGLDRLEAVLTDHPVERIVCGHLHRPMLSTIAGIPAQVGPATVHHVDLDLAPDAGVSLVTDPIGYQILRITDHGIVTHTRYLSA